MSLVKLSSISGISGISFCIRQNGLIGLIGISLVSLTGLVSHISLGDLWQRKQAALPCVRVRIRKIGIPLPLAATWRSFGNRLPLQSSATETAASTYYFASSSLHVYSLMRETMLWWLALAKKKMWRWIASFGESYHDNVLQFAKQLFSVRLLLMTKFFVMRECGNILSGYLCVVTTVFSQQDGIYGFKSPKMFLEISSPEISLFS
jgi:hypothetical protein